VPDGYNFTPAPGGARRLTAAQYVNSVRLLFGEAAASAATPPEDHPLHGFASIGNAQLALPEGDVEGYETSARTIAAAFVADDAAVDAVLPCTPSGPGDSACMRQFVSDVGQVAWRRPLEQGEIDALAAIGLEAAEALGTFDDGLFYATTALLQAPDFIYMIEVGVPDAADPTRRWLTPTELVTRMSFFLTNTTPDRVLLDAALAGEIEGDEAIRALAAELIAQPDAQVTLRGFFTELYALDRLINLPKSAEAFPEWNDDLALAMHQSMLALVDDVVWTRNADMRELFTADYAFVNEALAPIYEVEVSGSAFEKVTLPAEQQRRGLIGQAGYLASNSTDTRESAVKRGTFIRRLLMCDIIPPPPADVTPVLPDPVPGETMKERLLKHEEDEACANCHTMIDPPGFALQVFDGIGRYRTQEDGQDIDTSGDAPGLGAFADAVELAQLLSENRQVPSCLARNVYRFAIGHIEERGEAPAINDLNEAFVAGEHRVQSLLVSLVASPAFRQVSDPK
jgi:hypothetical protein